MRGRVRISCFAKQRNCEKSRRSSKLLYNLLVLPTLIGGLAAIGIATAAGYQSMAPTGQWYGRTFTGLARGTKQLALTYDDGPNDPHTLKLLEVLAKHEVHATFFMIGRYVRRQPDVAREVAAARLHVEVDPVAMAVEAQRADGHRPRRRPRHTPTRPVARASARFTSCAHTSSAWGTTASSSPVARTAPTRRVLIESSTARSPRP